MSVYRGFGLRTDFIAMLGQAEDETQELPGLFQQRMAWAKGLYEAPYVGVTQDGHVRPGLFTLQQTGVSTAPMVDAARGYLASVARPSFPIDAPEWRTWWNGLGFRLRHGVHLHDLDAGQREAALNLLRASLSLRGFDQVRTLMRLNGALGDLVREPAILGEWRYFLSIFGTPSPDEPWGWQIDGHHLNLNCFALGDQVILTPSFMGGEPKEPDAPEHAHLRAFAAEEAAGLALARSLSEGQRRQAILYPSMLSEQLPPERKHPSEGRMRGGAFQDNLVLPYEGILASELSQSQQDGLLDLLETYVGLLRDGHSRVWMDELKDHLAETYFAWIGRTDDVSPFFYKVHSPVILIEFDHHKGVFLDNPEPEKFHAHALIRTPNGNDYGKDLLRQHLARCH